jgi:hypothetical protein
LERKSAAGSGQKRQERPPAVFDNALRLVARQESHIQRSVIPSARAPRARRHRRAHPPGELPEYFEFEKGNAARSHAGILASGAGAHHRAENRNTPKSFPVVAKAAYRGIIIPEGDLPQEFLTD